MTGGDETFSAQRVNVIVASPGPNTTSPLNGVSVISDITSSFFEVFQSLEMNNISRSFFEVFDSSNALPTDSFCTRLDPESSEEVSSIIDTEMELESDVIMYIPFPESYSEDAPVNLPERDSYAEINIPYLELTGDSEDAQQLPRRGLNNRSHVTTNGGSAINDIITSSFEVFQSLEIIDIRRSFFQA